MGMSARQCRTIVTIVREPLRQQRQIMIFRLIVKVGPFCRKGLSLQGEQGVQPAEYRSRPYQDSGTEVAANREVLLGKEDLPKSTNAPE